MGPLDMYVLSSNFFSYNDTLNSINCFIFDFFLYKLTVFTSYVQNSSYSLSHVLAFGVVRLETG